MGSNRSREVGTTGTLRLAILQRVCPAYRVPLFKGLAAAPDIDFRLFIGAEAPEGKLKTAGDLSGIPVTRLQTSFCTIGTRTLYVHRRLIKALIDFEPDVILCEGESHFIGYLQALAYRTFCRPRTRILHWCFISLPGERTRRYDVAAQIKAAFRPLFDGFVVYSTYSMCKLLEMGVDGSRITVATNVGETERFLKGSESGEDRSAVRHALGLDSRFIALYCGTIDRVKRPELLVDIARLCDPRKVCFLIAGDGPGADNLREEIRKTGAANVVMLGRVQGGLNRYYAAADVLIVPGRGGIVMSEAMAAGLPVIVHQADGTECDLVESGITGWKVEEAAPECFAEIIDEMSSNIAATRIMGQNARALIASKYNTRGMVTQIIRAASRAVAGAQDASLA